MAVCIKVYGRDLHSKQSIFSLNVYVIKYTHTHTYTHWFPCRPLTDRGGVVVRLHSFLITSPDEEIIVRFTPLPCFRRRYMPHYEFKMRLGGPRHQSGLFAEAEISLVFTRNRTRFFGCTAPNLVTVLTEMVITQDSDKHNVMMIIIVIIIINICAMQNFYRDS